MKSAQVAKFSRGVLLFLLVVIIWGAYVRASGSGAGCGDHWPLCNGEVIPRSPRIQTIVEFAHRVSSGLSLIFVCVMGWLTFRAFPKGHAARKAAGASVFFIFSEAIIGAGLVLFELVAHDKSLSRAVSIALHLANTLLLLGSVTLTCWFSSGGKPLTPKRDRAPALAALSTLGLFIVLGLSGAVAALGDTLFPSESVLQGLRQDLAATSHFLLKLRVFHPLIAVATAIAILTLVKIAWTGFESRLPRRLAQIVLGLVGLQMALGLLNIVLLAPIWLQLVHLFVADSLWISLVLLSAAILSESPIAIQRDHATARPAAALTPPS